MEEEKKNAMYDKITLIIFTIVVTAIITFMGTFYYFTKKENDLAALRDVDSEGISEENSIDVIAQSLRAFQREIQKNYKGEIDEKKLYDYALKGYIEGLGDEYSEYFTKEEWEEFQVNAFGNYVGIGIYLAQDKAGNVVVLLPIEDSPAEKAGLKTGDIFTEINGETCVGDTSDTISNKIKGEAGSSVKIQILRENEYIDFDIVREEIDIYKMKAEKLENNIGYINILTFDENTANEFKQNYEELKSQGITSLIIDLRNNTGGVVNAALEIADMIVPKGKKILVTEDASGNKEISYSENDAIIDMEVVVLTNEYSASASEILVGALKDNDEATIVGTKTYGKGVIQEVKILSDGSALKLTIEEYYTPNENKIHKVGIEPNETVELPEDKNDTRDTQKEKAIEILK